jgi:hypothetical protein
MSMWTCHPVEVSFQCLLLSPACLHPETVWCLAQQCTMRRTASPGDHLLVAHRSQGGIVKVVCIWTHHPVELTFWCLLRSPAACLHPETGRRVHIKIARQLENNHTWWPPLDEFVLNWSQRVCCWAEDSNRRMENNGIPLLEYWILLSQTYIHISIENKMVSDGCYTNQKGGLQPQLDVTTSTAMVHKRWNVGCTMREYTAVLD